MNQELTQEQIDRVNTHLATVGARTDCLLCQGTTFECSHSEWSLFRLCSRCGLIHEFNLEAFGWRTRGGGSFPIGLTLVDLPPSTQAE